MTNICFEDRFILAATPTAVKCARMLTESTITKWGAMCVLDDVLLVLSELVTNAVKETGVPDDRVKLTDVERLKAVRIRLVGLESSILIEVWDCSPRQPIIRDANLDDEGGRGLGIVASIAHRWGSYPSHAGKVVWAELTVQSPTSEGPQ